ncbi:hypothetical protein ACFW0V_31965 [Micromonospora parva]|uniref:hypothetical protein n=1 Tax=Micromonospora parva TaxID=1464048 RepID=UPI00366BD6B4
MNAFSGRLADRVATVTGAGRRIGPALAPRLVADRARVGRCDGGVSLTGRAG